MQTDAPESIMILERTTDPERQCGESINEISTICRCLDITPSLPDLEDRGRNDMLIALMIELGS